MRARTILLCAFVVAAIGGALAWHFMRQPGPVASHKEDILLIYVGADDCAPCRKWQREDAVAFRASGEFGQITYREVKSPALFDILKDEHWPEELRSYRDRLAPGAGVPLWLIVSDNQIIEQRFGAAEWRTAVLPRIRSLLR